MMRSLVPVDVPIIDAPTDRSVLLVVVDAPDQSVHIWGYSAVEQSVTKATTRVR